MMSRIILVFGIILAGFLARATYFYLIGVQYNQGVPCSTERVVGAVSLDDIVLPDDANIVQTSCLERVSDKGLRSRRMIMRYVTSRNTNDISEFYDSRLPLDRWLFWDESRTHMVIPRSGYVDRQVGNIQSDEGLTFAYGIYPHDAHPGDYSNDLIIFYQLQVTAKPGSDGMVIVNLELREMERDIHIEF